MAKTAAPSKKPGTALAGFKTGAIMPKTKVKSGGGDAFIWVAHPMSKALWKDLNPKIKGGLNEADLIFVSGDHVERLQPMKYHLVEAFKFYATTDDEGDLIQTWDEEADDVPKEAAEMVEALIIVYTTKGPKPARMTFKKAVCKAVGAMLDEYRDAATEEWATRSKENKDAAKNVPDHLNGFRFYGVATCSPKPTRDGKFTYPLGAVQVRPSTPNEFATLKDADDQFTASLETSRQSFVARISDVKSKMK